MLGMFFFFLNVYFWDRERQSMNGGRSERGRHRIRNRLQALSCQHRAWRGARTHGPQDHDLSRSRPLNRLSHPGTPVVVVLKYIYKLPHILPCPFPWLYTGCCDSPVMHTRHLAEMILETSKAMPQNNLLPPPLLSFFITRSSWSQLPCWADSPDHHGEAHVAVMRNFHVLPADVHTSDPR